MFLWERWNSYTVEGGFHPTEAHNTSFNHYSYGSVVAWMFRGMAGISYDEEVPGFKHILLKPQPSRLLPEVQASYDSAYGRIVSSMRYEGEVWNYPATIPANTTATIALPVRELQSLKVNGQDGYTGVAGLRFAGFDSGRGIATFEAGAGTYHFSTEVC